MTTGFIITVALQILCAMHAARKANSMTWVAIIVFVPLIGALVYIFAVVLPDWSASFTGQKVIKAASKPINVKKEINKLKEIAIISPSVKNKQNLANAYIKAKKYKEAQTVFKSGLADNRYNNDLELLLGLIQTQFYLKQYQEVIDSYSRLIKNNSKVKSPEGHLLYARSLQAINNMKAAINEYEKLHTYYPGLEASARYYRALIESGKTEIAKEVHNSIMYKYAHSPSYYRKEQKKWIELTSAKTMTFKSKKSA